MTSTQDQNSESIHWLVEEYQKSAKWSQLRAQTQTIHRRELKRLVGLGNGTVGDLSYSELNRLSVSAMRSKVMEEVAGARDDAIAKRHLEDQAAREAGKPISKRNPPKPTTGARTADLFKSVISRLMTWAVEQGLAVTNPAAGIKPIRAPSAQ